MSRIFSGEPLPLPPQESNPERAAYDRKVTDYLRRLAGKLSTYVENNGGGRGTIALISLFKDTSQAMSASLASVPWKKTLVRDGTAFDHSNTLNPSRITVARDGFYLIHCDLYLDDGVTFPVVGLVNLISPAPGGIVSFGYSELDTPGTITLHVGVPLPAGAVFEIQARDSGGTGNIIVKGSRINVLRLRDSADGGTGGLGWIDPSDPNTWLELVMP